MLHYSSQRENPDFDRRGRMVSEAARRLAACEAKVSQALSLREKFVKDFQSVKENAIRGDEEDAARHMTDFVRELTLRAEVPVIGAGRGHAGQLIRRMFLEAKKSLHMISDDFDGGSGGELDPFPEPHSREYILRKSTSRPFPYSHPSPQRIYCCIRRDMFRLAGAFTVDKQYL